MIYFRTTQFCWGAKVGNLVIPSLKGEGKKLSGLLKAYEALAKVGLGISL